MSNYLNISKIYRQKIPSVIRNLVILMIPSLAIPRKTNISGHFRLNATIFGKFSAKIYSHNTLIIN